MKLASKYDTITDDIERKKNLFFEDDSPSNVKTLVENLNSIIHKNYNYIMLFEQNCKINYSEYISNIIINVKTKIKTICWYCKYNYH